VRVIADLFERQIVVASGEAGERPLADARHVYREHAEYVWTSLQRLGVHDADLEDVLQDVFIVVHRRLRTFDGSSKMTTWLFGICRRVASAYRRRGFRRNEMCVAEPEPDADAASPEHELTAAESRRRLDELLDELELDKRAVFVMFEIEELPCEDIAQILGVPLGTVYSRLHAARKAFQKALARMHAREAYEGRRAT
jgi:RNA polymerase sigma-70 factor (ECF subfamily)